jgi:hypothetical protein
MPQQARDGLLGKRSALLDLGTRDGTARPHHDRVTGAQMPGKPSWTTAPGTLR